MSSAPSDRIPTEIWQKILRFAIYVPIFLEIDPATVHGAEAIPKYCDDRQYWDTERDKNALQRVCFAWNVYLRRFQHRFVRLADVFHGFVPVESLCRAYRIYAGDCETGACVACWRVDINQEWNIPIHQSDGKEIVWNLEIVEIEIDCENFIDYLCQDNRLANLSAVVRSGYQFPKLEQLCNLRFYCGVRDDMLQHSSNITTLHVANMTRFFSHFLPQLRHLSIYLSPRTSPEFVEWLQDHGSRLLTLSISGGLNALYDIYHSIWTFCPELTTLHLRIRSKWTAPPLNHPIKDLCSGHLHPNAKRQPCAYCGGAHPYIMDPPVQDLLDAGIPTVALLHAWNIVFRYTNIPCVAAILRVHGISLVDRNRLTVVDYWVSQLETIRRGVRGYDKKFFAF
ncbi:hypothetical protein PIIN_06160 [Serendipita indica DSM 11827]|uniref:F-box domain-containing protein n=1 Tax=Serendipita indica (strain DSM 11827) TaxID=1109443 RepID=G4TLN2_SERID|nr:hypothetical protein PIIN_06160 [Serendipita indica DSM 11827]